MLLATVATAAAAAQASIAVAPFINTTVQRRMRREEEDVHKMIIDQPPHEETLILDKKNDAEEERGQQHFEKTSCVWSDLTHSMPIVDDGSVTFDYELIRPTKPNAMLCGRLTVDISDEYYTNLLLNESTAITTTTVGWIGIAISPEEGVINDSIAIIGLLPTTTSTSNDDRNDGPKQKNSVVQMYEISRSEWRGIATPMKKKYQTLTETSITLKEYIYAGVSKRLAVMTFGILLDVKQNNEKEDLLLAAAGGDEQQQQEEEKEVSIKEHGMNYFIFKQGMTTNELTTEDAGSIPFNDANYKYTIFTKDFDDDITVVSIITLTLASCQGLLCDLRVSYSLFSSNICFFIYFQPPFNSPSTTTIPSTSPYPTTSPTRLVERYFCSWNEKPLNADKICDANRFPTWFERESLCDCTIDEPYCLRVLCATTVDSSPAAVPTAVTSVPTMKPTDEPSSIVDMQSLEGLAFHTPENATMITKSIPLSRFVIDYYYLLPNEKGRERRYRSLRGEKTVFTTAMELELLNFVSDHLLERLEVGLDVQPTDVELLTVLNTLERIDIDGDSIASYKYAGNMMYQSVNVITASILNSEVLKAFNGYPGKTAFLARLQSSEDKVLIGVTDVKARLAGAGIDEDDTSLSTAAVVVVDDESNTNTLVNVQEGFSNDLIQVQEGFNNGSSSSMSVAIIAICAFAIITVMGGFLVANRYKKYRRNNDNNDYINYQNRKRDVTMTPRSIKVKSYFNFDTPNDGRSVAGADDNPIYDDLEIIGGNTYPSSQEHIDDDDDDDENPTRPLGTRFDRQQGLQFDPVCDVSLMPYDEKANTTIEGSSGIGMAARSNEVADGDDSTHSSMIYFSHIANQLSNDQLDMSLNESHDEHRTVDDLYSDKDSYFNSYNIVGKNHSFDTLDSLFDVNESISHLIDGIENMLVRKEEEEENPALLSPDAVHSNPIDSEVMLPSNLLTMLNTTMSTTATDGIHIGDVYEEQLMNFDQQCKNLSPDEELVANNNDVQNLEDEAQMVLNKLKILNGNMDSCIQIEDENENTCKYLQVLGASQRGADGSGYYVDDESETVGREFEGGISVVSLDKFISDSDSSIVSSSISATDELFARIADLEKKILNTETQFALEEEKVNFDKRSNAVTDLVVGNSVTVTPLPSPLSAEIRNETTIMSSSTLQLEFTKETLAMMQKRRLDCTPPPSHGDVDSEARKMVQEAQNNCLLGKFLDDTDSEEEVSTIYEVAEEAYAR